MLLVSVLGFCFGFCLLVVKLDYSIALGAFLIGAIMAESRHLHRIEHLIAPLRDAFSAIFFVTIGLMLNPAVLVDYAWPIAVITVAVIVGKIVSCGLGTFLAGKDGRTAMRVGMTVSQIGEFSFIIASLGLTLKVTSAFLYPIAVAVSALTTLFTPYLIRAADPLTRRLGRAMPPHARQRVRPVRAMAAQPEHRNRRADAVQHDAADHSADRRQSRAGRGDFSDRVV